MTIQPKLTDPRCVGSAEPLTTVSYRKRELIMYPVQKHEFEILASGYSSVHLGLFGCFFGGFITLLVTMLSVAMPEPLGTRFFVATLGLGLASVYCGLMAIRDYRNSRKVISGIRSETVDVVVAEGKKIG